MNSIKKLVRFFLTKLNVIRGDIHRNDVYGGIHKAWGYVFTNHLNGDYVEFGVYKGSSAVSSIKIYDGFRGWLFSQKKSDELWRREVANKSPLNQKITFHCFDTFEGMPENNEGAISFQKGNFACDLESVKERISLNNKNLYKVEYYKGLFSDTGKNFHNNIGNNKIAIANIDCDLEESSYDALKIIENNLQIGTIILFDDFNCFNADNNRGQRKAFLTFKKQTNFTFEKFFTYNLVGQSFLVVAS